MPSSTRATRGGRRSRWIRPWSVVLLLTAVLTATDGSWTPAGAADPTATEVLATTGVAFAQSGATTLTLDVYRPDDLRANRPGVLLIHGGGWFQGQSGDMQREGELLARQGWVAFSINYRLAAPGRPAWPGNLDDVRAAVWWVGRNATTYGVDADKLALVGASAGGHLAAMVATTGIGGAPPDGVALIDPPAVDGKGIEPAAVAPRVRVAAAWSPPVDLAALAPRGDQPPTGCGENTLCQAFWGPAYWGIGAVPLALGCEVDQCPDTYRAASPVDHVGRDTTPVWLVNSTDEIVPLNQVDRFAATLTAAGVPNTEKVLPGTVHPYDYTSDVWNDMMPFLAIYLGVPAPPPVDFHGTPPRTPNDFAWLLLGGVGLGVLLLVTTLALKHRWDEA